MRFDRLKSFLCFSTELTQWKRFLCFLCVVLPLVFVANAQAQGLDALSGGASVLQTEEPQSTGYLLQADDMIKVTVAGESELSGVYEIDSKGFVLFPLVGKIALSGLNERSAAMRIERELQSGYIKSPSVSVSLSTQHMIYLVGEVKKPGGYPYKASMSITDAVHQAGGFTHRAETQSVEVLKPRVNEPDLYETLLVHEPVGPGNIILVKERSF